MKIEERKRIIEIVKKDIENYLIEIEYKQKHGRTLSIYERNTLINYIDLLDKIRKWEKDNV